MGQEFLSCSYGGWVWLGLTRLINWSDMSESKPAAALPLPNLFPTLHGGHPLQHIKITHLHVCVFISRAEPVLGS